MVSSLSLKSEWSGATSVVSHANFPKHLPLPHWRGHRNTLLSSFSVLWMAKSVFAFHHNRIRCIPSDTSHRCDWPT